MTPEASDLLRKIRDGGAPAFTTANLIRIAKENGVETNANQTPNEIIDHLLALAEKERSQLPMLDHALDYLRQGWPVFPICCPIPERPGWCHEHGSHDAFNERRAERGVAAAADPGKHPMVNWAQFQTRLPSEEEVRSWWARWPHANLGLATGALSGVVVLDCDGMEAFTAVLSRGGVEPTATVETGKPNGFHWYLKHPAQDVRNFAGNRGITGLDFRGDGGYVVLPPSLHRNGNRYRWKHSPSVTEPRPIPSWLMGLLTESPERPQEGAARPSIDVARILDGVPEGERDDTLYRTACKMRADDVPIAYAELLIRMAARNCSPPFPEQIAAAKVMEAYRHFQPTPVLGLNGIVSAKTAPAGPFELQNLAELCELFDDLGDQLVEGILWTNRTHWAFAPPGAGKTLFLLALGMHIAAGRPFGNRAITQGPVLLFEEDSPFSVVAEYVTLLADVYEFDLATIPFWVNKHQGFRCTDDAGIATIQAAIAACPEQPTLFIFDSCERIVPSRNFNSDELDPLIRAFQWLLEKKITVVMIDHEKKQQTHSGSISLIDRLYGGRSKSGISDIMLYFDGSPQNGIELKFAKVRGEVPAPLNISFAPDTGFRIKDRPEKTRTPTERKLLAWFNNVPTGWYELRHVLDEASVPDRSGRRALETLVRRRWILKQGTKKEGTEYRVNPDLPGAFE